MEGNLLEKLDAYLHCKLMRQLQWNYCSHHVAINKNRLSLPRWTKHNNSSMGVWKFDSDTISKSYMHIMTPPSD